MHHYEHFSSEIILNQKQHEMIALIILKMNSANDHDVVTWKKTSVDCSSQAAPRVFHTAMQTDLVPELIVKKNLDQSNFSSRRHLSTWAKSGI